MRPTNETPSQTLVSSPDILIAHRPHAICEAGQIVVMEAGRIAGTGRHDALLRQHGLYVRLWRALGRAAGWQLK